MPIDLVRRENLRWIGQLFGISTPENVRSLDVQPIQPVLDVGAIAANSYGFFYSVPLTLSPDPLDVHRGAITREDLFSNDTAALGFGVALSAHTRERGMRQNNTDVWLVDTWATVKITTVANLSAIKTGWIASPVWAFNTPVAGQPETLFSARFTTFNTTNLLAAGTDVEAVFRNSGGETERSGQSIVDRRLPIFLPPSLDPASPTRLLGVVVAGAGGQCIGSCYFRLWFGINGHPPPS
jgi:hypothetical protein